MSFEIEEVNGSNKEEYESYISSKDSTTFVDSFKWREVVSRVYNMPQFWFMAKESNTITGILALTLVRHPLFGRYLITAPFANHGGFYADSETAFYGLLEKACSLKAQLKTKYVLVRHLQTGADNVPPNGWINDPLYATFHLPLAESPEIFWKNHLRGKIRNLFSKSTKQGFSIIFGRQELLDDFWYIISRSMKELGSPYHSKYFLQTILDVFGTKVELAIIYTKNHVPAGGGLLISYKNHVVLLHGNSLMEYRKMLPSDFMYWSVISRSCNGGAVAYLDMGRSLIGSGNERFKMKLRPVRRTLSYWYHIPPGKRVPKLNQNNSRFQLMIKIWQKMPLPVARKIGPLLISGIL